MSQYAATLARNLAEIAPGDLDMVFLGSTGSEAVEAALKLAENYAGTARPKVAYAELAFHGKTRGALSVTGPPSDCSITRFEYHLAMPGPLRICSAKIRALGL